MQGDHTLRSALVLGCQNIKIFLERYPRNSPIEKGTEDSGFWLGRRTYISVLFLFIFWIFLIYFFIQHVLLVIHLYTSVYTCQSQSPDSSHHHSTHHFPHLVSIRLFSTSVSLFLPCKLVHLYHFSRFHTYELIYDNRFSLFDLLHSVWQSLGPSTSLQMTQFRSFL